MSHEPIWVEPFARVRRHPAFKYYSQMKYGDPEALDRKILTRLVREIALSYEGIFSQRLVANYQEGQYYGMLLTGILAQDKTLIDFAAPNQELTLYNHHYQDGLNGEGAANYMGQLAGYYYEFLGNPRGSWQELYPDFLKDHPFFKTASSELFTLKTARGLELEFADEHIQAYSRNFLTDPAAVREHEAIPSKNWPGWGIGIVRVGGPGHRQELTLASTRTALHSTADPLGIACWFDGVPVMRPGGYAHHPKAPLDFSRPEIAGLNKMGYPHELVSSVDPDWSWPWAHSPMAQNTVTVDNTFPSGGWEDNRGFGEPIAFKGGEAPGEPGAHFQVLESRDRDSFERVGVKGVDFRRALLAVEAPGGRPYALDVTSLCGGTRHALYNSAWAERAGDSLPPVAEHQDNLLTLLKPDQKNSSRDDILKEIRHCEQLKAPIGNWELAWATDFAAYAPRDPKGAAFVRPLPADTGKVRLRFIGVPDPSAAGGQLIRARAPWVSIVHQPLANGETLYSNVGFLDATDLLIETRQAQLGSLTSRFVHVIEGYRDGEQSALGAVQSIPFRRTDGQPADALALQIELRAGGSDTIIYQAAPSELELPGSLKTDARYALIRRDKAGQIVEVHAVEATHVTCGALNLTGEARFSGVIQDLDGDLTGNRQASALIVKPDNAWPAQPASGCRQLIVEGPNPLRAPFREAYAVDRLTALPGGLVRIDLAGAAPLAAGWHQVTELNPAARGVCCAPTAPSPPADSARGIGG